MSERFLFSVSLRVHHPSISAEQVVDIFGWTPKIAQTVHEQRRTRSGKELPGRYSETFVLFPLDVEDHEFPEDFLSAYLAEPESPGVRAIRRVVDAGCRVTFVFGISCPQSSGFDLDRRLIEAVHLTGASLSFFLYGSA